jgi:predicted transposase YbfD/YdcC
MAETSASPEVVNRSGRSGNKKERVVSDPLLIVACSLNQSFDDPIGEFNRQFKQAVTASVIGARQQVSRHLVSQSIDWMSGKRRYPDEPGFKGLRTIAMTETSIERDGGVRTEPRCYISSRLLTAQASTTAARAHWAIENGLHWVLDVTFKEDQSRLRRGRGATNMALIRHPALHVIRSMPGKTSIKGKRKLATWDTDDLANASGLNQF